MRRAAFPLRSCSVRRGRRAPNQNGLAFPKSDALRLGNGKMPHRPKRLSDSHDRQEVDSLGVCRKYYNLTETALRIFPATDPQEPSWSFPASRQSARSQCGNASNGDTKKVPHQVRIGGQVGWSAFENDMAAIEAVDTVGEAPGRRHILLPHDHN